MVAKLIVLHAANSPENITSSTRKFSKEEKEWWAIQPLKIPKAQTEGNPVDYFIQRKLEKQNLGLSGQADAYEILYHLLRILSILHTPTFETQIYYPD